jgi:hypothetical protein
MCAASGLVGIILPGVAVAATEEPLIPIFPEPICVLSDSILFPEIAVGENGWVVQADMINDKEISNGNRNTLMKLAPPKTIWKYIRQHR